MANTRRYRLELPAAPKTDDPAKIQQYLSDIRRLTMDEFNRLSGDFFDFRQEVIDSSTIPLASVAAIAVDPSTFSATFTWENPAQTQGVPTHVRVRIAEFGDTWAEYTYPITTWTAYGLNPSTEYTFQIQLVRRASSTVSFVSALRNCPSIPVQVESLSDIRSRSFTTDGGLGPPTDDGGGGSVFPIPDPPGGTGGPVGGTGCWWEWQIQVVNLTTGLWDDTTYSGTAAGNIGNIAFDISVLDPLRVYRMKYREVCNGVPGPWQYGGPFTGGADWADNCGGLDVSDSRFVAPYDDADLWVIPYMCFVEGEGLFIREYLSGVEIIPGMGYRIGYTDAEGEVLLFADEWADSPVARLVGSTYLPSLVGLDNSDDFSIAVELKFPDFPVPPVGGFGTENIINIGDGRLQFNITYNNNGNWGVQFIAVREIGGTMILNSPLTLTGGTADWTNIKVSVDQDGYKVMSIDDAVVATDATNEEIRLDGMTGAMQIKGMSDMRIRKFYGWNRALEYDGFYYMEDDFNRANGPLGLSWVGHTTNIVIVDNMADGHNGASGREVYWSQPCLSEDLFVEIDIVDAGGVFGHPQIRLAKSPAISSIEPIQINAGWGAGPGGGSGNSHLEIGGLVVPSVYLATALTPTNKTLRMEKQGTTIRQYVNGAFQQELLGETTPGLVYIGFRASHDITINAIRAGAL